jgi:hypothetical protein
MTIGWPAFGGGERGISHHVAGVSEKAGWLEEPSQLGFERLDGGRGSDLLKVV